MPVAAPVAAGNSWGTALNTAPFPRPRNTASVRHAIVTGTMVGSPEMTASAAASSPTSRKTTASTVAAPTRSESIPPTGRASVASTVKPAARRPASVRERSNQSWSSFGRNTAIATNPPNVTK